MPNQSDVERRIAEEQGEITKEGKREEKPNAYPSMLYALIKAGIVKEKRK